MVLPELGFQFGSNVPLPLEPLAAYGLQSVANGPVMAGEGLGETIHLRSTTGGQRPKPRESPRWRGEVEQAGDWI